MVASSVATLAFFCPQCGKLKMHTVSKFTIKTGKREFYCSCGQLQAQVVSISRWQYLLEVPCMVCEKKHLIGLDSKKLWHSDAIKIYCDFSNMELGLAGNRQKIENTIASQYDAAFKLLKETPLANEPYDSNYFSETEIENPPIMLEILNKIHDIAEKGGLYCCCGSVDVRINLLENAIEIICAKCDGSRIIPARCESDRTYAETLIVIEIAPIVKGIKNI